MSGPAKKFEVGPFLPEGSKIKRLEVEAPEDSDDKRLRLLKEFWTWVVKDLSAYVLSYVFVLLIALYCFYVVARY